jgi:hypothetical protein
MAQQSETECIICYETIKEGQTRKFDHCSHGDCVHTTCIQQWNKSCPLCRTVISNIKPVNNYENIDLDTIIINNINNYINHIIINSTSNPLLTYIYENINQIVYQIKESLNLNSTNNIYNNIRNHVYNNMNIFINEYNQNNIFINEYN